MSESLLSSLDSLSETIFGSAHDTVMHSDASNNTIADWPNFCKLQTCLHNLTPKILIHLSKPVIVLCYECLKNCPKIFQMSEQYLDCLDKMSEVNFSPAELLLNVNFNELDINLCYSESRIGLWHLYLFIYLFNHLFIYLSIYLFTCIYLFI